MPVVLFIQLTALCVVFRKSHILLVLVLEK